jgi:hypothetical protein
MTHRHNEEPMEQILTACSICQFHTVWMNYSLSLPQTTVVELDVLARGSDTDSCWALVFEIKNRDEKHTPTLTEAQWFVTKVERVRQLLAEMDKKIQFVCPVYLSAKGFEVSVEEWLHKGYLPPIWQLGKSISRSIPRIYSTEAPSKNGIRG